MGNHYDVAVIGGGVIGGSIAYHLAKKGQRVILLEKDKITSGASSAAAGMLGAQSEMHEAGALFELARQSRAIFPRIAQELKELTGIDIGLVQKGLLKIALTAEQAEEYKELMEFQLQAGEQAEWLSTAQAREMEPNLSELIHGSMYIPNDGQVQAPVLSAAFVHAAVALGAIVKEHAEVTSLRIEQGKITGVFIGDEAISCNQAVVAAGVWGQQLLQQVDLSLGIFPVKGECFSVVSEAPLVTTTLFSPGCYLVPKRGNRLIVGATMIDRSYTRSVSVNGLMQLMDKAIKLVPSITSADWEASWAGLRPQTPDGLPYLGEAPACQNLYVAAGHYRNGILLSPITGDLISDLLLGKRSKHINLDAFRVDRHTEAFQARGGK